MPALNFQARFADAVECGKKRQTIRRRRKRPIKVGDILYLYTGQRTKRCRKLGEARCISVREVTISAPYGDLIIAGGHGLNAFVYTTEGIRRLLRQDGFQSEKEMIDWFQGTHGLPFEGVLIRWSLISAPDPGGGNDGQNPPVP